MRMGFSSLGWEYLAGVQVMPTAIISSGRKSQALWILIYIQLTDQSTFGNERDADCGKTYGNGYQSVLLLPPLNEGVFNSSTLSNDPYPYSINVPYRVVEYSMTRGMVMVPIAAAFAIIAMLMFIFGSYKMAGWVDWVSGPLTKTAKYSTDVCKATTILSALAAILGWASFGIAYQLTDKVRDSLEEYNRNGLNNGFTLASIRGNATWILLAGTVSLRRT